ncbi:hypothetical protein K457DRAFT_209240 [Linnemannia elongata AG-77]|uniref:Uncharacterized protein n=1 Tax=Linnemannia elongata AG-77 TaxID=1314771 RepID=A0A197JFZ4_9FUNG|nr:hypothetical protein K457DRAFT_209240 [Linnemannia elongata AG-77]
MCKQKKKIGLLFLLLNPKTIYSVSSLLYSLTSPFTHPFTSFLSCSRLPPNRDGRPSPIPSSSPDWTFFSPFDLEPRHPIQLCVPALFFLLFHLSFSLTLCSCTRSCSSQTN